MLSISSLFLVVCIGLSKGQNPMAGFPGFTPTVPPYGPMIQTGWIFCFLVEEVTGI